MAELIPIWYEPEEGRACDPTSRSVIAPLLAAIADGLKYAVNLSGVAIAHERAGEQGIVCVASSGEAAPAVSTVLDVSSGISGRCIRENRILVSNDTASDSRVSREACERLGIRSLVAVPLRKSARCVGLLLAVSDEIDRFDSMILSRIEHEASHIEALLPPALLKPVETASVSDHDKAEAGSHSGSFLATADADASPKSWTLEPEPQATPWAFRGLRFHRWITMAVVIAVAVSAVWLVLRHAKRTVSMTMVRRIDPVASSQPTIHSASDAHAETDVSAAVRHVIELAESDNVRAQVVLAHRYFKGDGVAPDRIKASVWYIIAGANGDERAKQSAAAITRVLPSYDVAQIRFDVGKLYMEGIGIKRDLSEAYSWFALAQAAGDVRASTEQQRLEQMMSPEQVSQALRRASDWMLAHKTSKQGVPTVIADSSRMR